MSLINMYDYVKGEFYSATDLQQPITGSDIVKLYDNESGDVSLAFSSLVIYTGAGHTGTLLVLDTDFTLQLQDSYYTTEESINIYKGFQVINASYQGVTLYADANVLGGFVGKTYIDTQINDTVTYVDTEVDSRIPIGFIYHQLPSQPTPATLFGGTWSNISSTYAGLFFRAEGGNASAFEAGTQGFMMQSHNHVGQWAGAANGGGGFEGIGSSLVSGAAGNVTGAVYSGTAGVENRPVNKTIRIWERTA